MLPETCYSVKHRFRLGSKPVAPRVPYDSVKLVRFQQLDAQPDPKAGFIHSGRIYETDGENPIAIHEPESVKLLPPVQPPTVRLFDVSTHMSGAQVFEDADLVPFAYTNPYSLLGPNAILSIPDYAIQLSYRVSLAAICHQGTRISVEEADSSIIGYSLLLSVVARNVERRSYSARAFDFGAAFGPALTTPDELEENLISTENGDRYSIPFIVKVNGIETARGTTATLPISMAQAITVASESCSIQSGDMVAIGPLHPDEQAPLGPGDFISVSADKIGTLNLRLGSEDAQ